MAPSPEGVLLGAEADAKLTAALAELGDERRAALLLRIDHGLDYDQIAEVMGWPLSKVKNEIHRARHRVARATGEVRGRSVMCSTEELEALVAEELDVASAERVRAHVAGCASCQAELDVARRRGRADGAAARPATGPGAVLWPGIAERVADDRRTAHARSRARIPPPRRSPLPAPATTRVRRWGWGARVAYGGLLAAAAAAVVFATWPGQVRVVPGDLGGRPSLSTAAVHKKVPADVTLDKAEREYQDAAKVLEAEYAAERDRLPPSVAERYDRMLSTTRTQVADARATAGSDVDGRMVVLDGYAEYLRNLQTIVSDLR